VAMASDGVNVCAPSQPTPVAYPGPGERGPRPCPGLGPAAGCRHLGLYVGLLRNDEPRTAPRLVSGCPAQERRQPGPPTAQFGGSPLFGSPALLGGGLDCPPLPPPRPRSGRLDAGATLHAPLDPRGRPRLCHPRGLARRRGPACWRLAPPWGSALWLLTGQRARRLHGDGAGRPWLVRPLAVYHDASARLASFLAHQSPRPLSGARLCHLASADAGGQPCRVAGGWPGHRLCHPHAATHVHPTRALGCRLSRPLVDPHRPAANRRRCRVVWVARLDRVRVQRQQTRRLALGTDQEAGTRTGRAALARPGRGALLDRQGGLPSRRRAPPGPVAPRSPSSLSPARGPRGHARRAPSGASGADGWSSWRHAVWVSPCQSGPDSQHCGRAATRRAATGSVPIHRCPKWHERKAYT
jgi:hypothetical protein